MRRVAADGSSETIVDGGMAQLSDDAGHLAFARASTCGPDEVDPANWVHAPLDTIVWRNLGTGQERAWRFPGAVLNSDVVAPVSSISLAGEGIVALVSDRLVIIDTAESASVEVTEGPVVSRADDEIVQLLGVRPDGAVIALRAATGQSGARIVALNAETGAETDVAAFSNHTMAALHRDGTDLAVFTAGVVSINGRPVELAGIDPGGIASIGW